MPASAALDRCRRGWVLGSLLAAALPAHAQTPAAVRRVGYLSTGSRSSTYRRPLDAFREALRDRGWIEGRNLVVDERYAEGRADRLPALAEELVRLRVDVIAASPTPAALAARAATRTIPIVGMGLTEPVAVGLVASLSRPEGNVTGVAYSIDADIAGKQLELLKDVVPRARRIAVLSNPGSSPSLALIMGHLDTAARSLDLELQRLEARAPQDFEAAFAEMARQRADALLVTGDAMFFQHRERLAGLAVANRLPAMSTQAQWVEGGGLVAYGPSLPALWRAGAFQVDRILRGARPADLPIEQPTTFELVVNLKTARALGLVIPKSLLNRADAVID